MLHAMLRVSSTTKRFPERCAVDNEMCVTNILHLWDAVRRKRLEKLAQNRWFLLYIHHTWPKSTWPSIM
jgi:hypothetical protein